MAFVFRSPKDVDKIQKKEELDEYNFMKEKIDFLKERRDYSSILNNNSSNISNFSQKNKAPFGTNALKTTFHNHKGPNYPGPGTYDIDNFNNKKQFNKNNTSPEEKDNEDGNKKRIFISQEKRFNKSKYEVNFPGPGKYYTDNNDRKYNKNGKKMHITEFNKYETFSKSRILSIPCKGNDFGYEMNKDGVMKLMEDPQKYYKYSGTKNNSVGPGQYNSCYNPRNSKFGIIDWNKSMNHSVNRVKEKKLKEIDNLKKKENMNKFNGSQYDSNYYLSNLSTTEPTINSSLSIINYNKKNKTNNYFYTDIGFDRKNIEIKFSNSKIIKNDNFSRTINRTNLSPFFKLETKPELDTNIKEDKFPGPGAYLSLNNYNYMSKDEKHQFFGSSMSRGIMYPNLTNNIKIGKNNFDCILDSEILEKSKMNRSKSFKSNISNIKTINDKKYKKQNKFKKIDKVEITKEISKNNKKEIENNLGPGSYNPEKKIKNCYSYEVGNFGSLERRFPLFPSSDEFPGAGSYIHLATWGPKKKNNNLDKKIPPNITKKISEGISSNKMDLFRDKIMKENHKQPGIGQYDTENINTIDSNTKKSVSVSKNQPGFGSSFKRFYIFKNQINENNGVGTYDLKFPDNKIYKQNAAFLGVAGRTDIDDNKKKNLINPIAGPGSYRKDSYFDWNKKSYNILFN